MNRFAGLIVAFLIASLLTGCIASSAGLAPSSTPIGGREYTVIGETVGSGWDVSLLGIPLSTGGNNTYKAREAALAKVGADGLIKATVDNVMYMFVLVNLQRTRVTGQAIKFVD